MRDTRIASSLNFIAPDATRFPMSLALYGPKKSPASGDTNQEGAIMIPLNLHRIRIFH